MIRLLILSTLFLINVAVFAEQPSTPSVVTRFYKTMEQIGEASSDAQAFEYVNILKDCFYDGRMSVPNDFYSFGFKEGINKDGSKIYLNIYSDRYKNLSYEKKALSINYKVGNSTYVSEVDLKQHLKQNQSPEFVRTVISKTFYYNAKPSSFSDTIVVYNNKIVAFVNGINTGASSENIETLRALAASYYSSKRYFDAYRTYEKIIKIDPRNANAYYRIGVMTYYREGCYISSKKEAHKKGISYVEKAQSLGFYKAETALFYMKHPQSV